MFLSEILKLTDHCQELKSETSDLNLDFRLKTTGIAYSIKLEYLVETC